MKLNYKLTKEEKWIEDHMEEFVPVSPAEKRKIMRDLASMRKRKAITLRVNENDLNKIKEKAVREGMPYQTLISSVLHKYADNMLKETEAPYGRPAAKKKVKR